FRGLQRGRFRGAISTLEISGTGRFGATRMIGIVQPRAAAVRRGGYGFVRFCAELCVCYSGANGAGGTMPTPDKQLSAEQSRQVAHTVREEIARRRISRQALREPAK